MKVSQFCIKNYVGWENPIKFPRFFFIFPVKKKIPALKKMFESVRYIAIHPSVVTKK